MCIVLHSSGNIRISENNTNFQGKKHANVYILLVVDYNKTRGTVQSVQIIIVLKSIIKCTILKLTDRACPFFGPFFTTDTRLQRHMCLQTKLYFTNYRCSRLARNRAFNFEFPELRLRINERYENNIYSSFAI